MRHRQNKITWKVIKSLIKIWRCNVWTALIPLLSLLQKTLVIRNMHYFQKSKDSCLGWKKNQKKFLEFFSIFMFLIWKLYSHKNIGTICIYGCNEKREIWLYVWVYDKAFEQRLWQNLTPKSSVLEFKTKYRFLNIFKQYVFIFILPSLSNTLQISSMLQFWETKTDRAVEMITSNSVLTAKIFLNTYRTHNTRVGTWGYILKNRYWFWTKENAQ